MSRNGSGIYNLPAGNPVTTGTVISSTWANTTLSDIANALTQSLSSDGQTPLSGNLNFNGNQATGLATATLAGQAVEYSQFAGAFTNPTITGNITVTGNGTFSGTGALKLPSGTTAQEPVSPVNGMIRYNSTTGQFEGYASGVWGSIGGGATGGGGDQVFQENSLTVTTSYSIPTGKSASSVGPIAINSGVTVTIPSGSKWVVL